MGGRAGNKCSLNRCSWTACELGCLTVDAHAVDRLLEQHVEQERQSNHVVQVRVRQENVQGRIRQLIAHAIHGGARVQHDAAFGQHHAGCLTRVRRMVAGSPQQNEFHSVRQ